jgi:hypothetical protein
VIPPGVAPATDPPGVAPDGRRGARLAAFRPDTSARLRGRRFAGETAAARGS